MEIRTEHVTTDVLIIGAGIAGVMAAVRASESGADVMLVTKGMFARDGASTWMAGPGIQVALYPPDSPDVHAADTIKAGRYLADQKLVFECTKAVPQVFHHLCDWGARFARKDGRFVLRRLPGETYPRVPALERTGEYAGLEYKRVMRNRVLHSSIKTVSDMLILDLLTNGGTVTGAVGLDIRQGTITVFTARAVILATGGYIGCYPATLAPAATGDGCAMAFRAGAEMCDMEFVDFYTYVGVWPVAFRGCDWPAELVYNLGARMINRVGDEFRSRYTGALRNPPLAAASELRAGRGSRHGGIYLSLKHLPNNVVSDFVESVGHQKWTDQVRSTGFDLCNESIEIAPMGITSFGGCKVNEKCEATLEGLYAVGEASAGKEGAYTMAGNSIPLSGAMGYLAGGYASDRAKKSPLPDCPQEQVGTSADRIRALAGAKTGYRPHEAGKLVQDILQKYGGLIGRNDSDLKKGLAEIQSVRSEVLPRVSSGSGSHRFDLDLVGAIEVTNMVDICELILRSALARTESRGLHYRQDYPEESPDWLKRVVVRKSHEEVTVGTEPVVLDHLVPSAEKAR